MIAGFHRDEMIAGDQICFRSLAIAENIIDSHSVVVHTGTAQRFPTGVRFALVGMKVTERVDKLIVGNEIGEPQTRRTGMEIFKIIPRITGIDGFVRNVKITDDDHSTETNRQKMMLKITRERIYQPR